MDDVIEIINEEINDLKKRVLQAVCSYSSVNPNMIVSLQGEYRALSDLKLKLEERMSREGQVDG